eukprot:TRINITY_DN12318_c0_g1_i1.p1 TRINITY_DN12318_c0_g1~~TRINITY_DN12318_c0_g1_i1.p1  ORF type:complete len:1527 (+),score=574.95 TRINITY_DN12318_c0_g1_i1:184-4764(+)
MAAARAQMTPESAAQLLRQLVAEDLRAMVAEAKKKHPPVKDACEQALAKLADLAGNRAKQQTATLDAFLNDAEELWKPLVLACDFRNPRLSAISVGAIQKLISRALIPGDSVGTIVQCLVKLGADVDEAVQLRVLNCLMTLFSSDSGYDMSVVLLRDVMSLGFSMHLSRNAVVQSTAAATINQVALAQFDRLAVSLPPQPPGEASPPPSPPQSPSCRIAQDKLSGVAACACLLFKDLCVLLAPPRSPGGQHMAMHLPTFKIAGETPKVFILDVLYGIVQDHHRVIAAHPQLLPLVTEDLSAVLLHAMQAASDLPTVVRVHRVATAALQRFPQHLHRQQEAMIASMIRVVEAPATPTWYQVVVLMCWRELAENYYYLKRLYGQAGNGRQEGALFADLVGAVCRLVQKFPPQAYCGISMTAERVSMGKLLAVKGDEDVLVKQGEGVVWAIDALVAVCKSLSKLVEIECRPLTDAEITNAVEQQPQKVAQHMLKATWQGVLAGCTHLLELCEDEETVEVTLRCFKQCCHSCGKVGLNAERDQFLRTMNRFTLPNSTPGSLTPKNVQVLRVLFDVANVLGGALGSSWGILLTNFQHLNAILSTSGCEQGSDLQLLRSLLAEVFGRTQHFEDAALLSMFHALCQLTDAAAPPPVYRDPQSPAARGGGGAAPSTFGLQRLAEISVTNITRLPLYWRPLRDHLARLVADPAANEALRKAVVDTVSQVLLAYLKKFRQPQAGSPARSDSPRAHPAIQRVPSMGSSPAVQGRASPLPGGAASEEFLAMQHQVVDVLRVLMASGKADVKVACLNLVFMALQRTGQDLRPESWRTILELLAASSADAGNVNVGWKSVEYIYFNFLQQLGGEELQSLITCVGRYAKQSALPDKTNMNLSAIQQGLLSIADFCSNHPSGSAAAHWNSLFAQLRDATADARPHVRNTAIHTLFTALVTHGNGLPTECWNPLFADVLLKVLDAVHSSAVAAEENGSEQVQAQKGVRVHHSRDTVAKQWHETRRTVLEGVARLIKVFYTTCAKSTEDFKNVLTQVAGHLAAACLHSATEVATVGLRCLQDLLVDVSVAAVEEDHPLVLWRTAWGAWEAIADAAGKGGEAAPQTQVVQALSEGLAEIYTSRNVAGNAAQLTKYLAAYNTVILPLLGKVLKAPAARDAMTFPSKIQTAVFKCISANPVPRENVQLRTDLLHLLNSSILPCPVVDACIKETQPAALGKLVGAGQTQLTARVLQLIHERYCDPGRKEAPEVCMAGFVSTVKAFQSVLLTRYIAVPRYQMHDEIVSTMTDVFTRTLPQYQAGSPDVLPAWDAILSMCEAYWRAADGAPPPPEEAAGKGDVCDAGVLGMLELLLLHAVRHNVPDVLRRAVEQLARCSAQREQRGTSSTALQSLFQLCNCPDGDEDALRIGRVALPVVAARCTQIVEEYIAEAAKGASEQRTQLHGKVVSVLDKLAGSKISPVLYDALPDAAGLRARCPAAFGARGLPVRMFPQLISLVGVGDAALTPPLTRVLALIAEAMGLAAPPPQ